MLNTDSVTKPFLEKGLDYLSHQIKAKSRFRIHSPFLFRFMEDVLRDRAEREEFSLIKSLRKELLKNNTVIQKFDLGAGNRTTSVHINNEIKKASIPEGYGKLLFRITNYFKSSRVLELGTSFGIGTFYLAIAQKSFGEGEVYTLEGCPETLSCAKNNRDWLTLNGHNLQNIQFIEGDFKETLPEVLEEMGKVDLVFFDGNHRKGPTLEYFKKVLPYTTEKTVLIFDDIHWSVEMEEAWKEIKSHPKITLSLDLYRLGIAFLDSNLSKQDEIIRYGNLLS